MPCLYVYHIEGSHGVAHWRSNTGLTMTKYRTTNNNPSFNPWINTGTETLPTRKTTPLASTRSSCVPCLAAWVWRTRATSRCRSVAWVKAWRSSKLQPVREREKNKIKRTGGLY
jgi:hypothetical protein